MRSKARIVMEKSKKVINIMSMLPPYSVYGEDNRPRVWWPTSRGSWVGIWGYDWDDQIGQEILRVNNEFNFEVWQPDLRANKIYSCIFPNGLVHRLFPAEKHKRYYGYKKEIYAISPALCKLLLKEMKTSKLILRVFAHTRLGLSVLNLNTHCPSIAQFWGEVADPVYGLRKIRKNIIGQICDVQDFYRVRRALRNVDFVTCCDARSMKNLKRYFDGKIVSLSIGIDFGFWKRRKDRARIRRTLSLDSDSIVLLASCRLNSLKQIDKVIHVLKKLDNKFNFVFVVTGHGEQGYESHLRHLGESLTRAGKLIFAGYVSDEKLADYYSIADLFIMSSLSEAGPTAAVKALAMEVPVFTTNTGQMAEVMAEHGAGVIVPRRDYGAWERELREILSGKKIKILDREIVKKIHHWPYVAKQYIDLYNKLFEKYYGSKQKGRCV
jgi:glycosyltransferase involved in cell wall biosynthesis